MYFRLNEAIFVLDVIPFEPGEEGGSVFFPDPLYSGLCVYKSI